MRRIMLVGERGVGRRSLARALGGGDVSLHRPLAVEYAGYFVFPPPEFLENRRFYRALITTSMECGTLLLIQDATRRTSLFPPGFARIFNRNVLGIITKIDVYNADVALAERFLGVAGLIKTYAVSTATGQGVEVLRGMMLKI